MSGTLGGFVRGLGSLVVGMAVTGRHFVRKPVTVRYPRQKPTMSRAYRGVIAFVRFPETGTHDCIACDICAKVCPSDCIVVEGTKPEGVKGKRATLYEIDFALCSLCGLCVDACPTATLDYSKIYDDVGRERDGFVYDLLEPFRADEPAYLERARAQAAAEAEEKARKKAEAEARKRAAGGEEGA